MKTLSNKEIKEKYEKKTNKQKEFLKNISKEIDELFEKSDIFGLVELLER